MSEHERPPEPPPATPTEPSVPAPPPPFDPQIDLIGDMERGQDWIVDHRTHEVRRSDPAGT